MTTPTIFITSETSKQNISQTLPVIVENVGRLENINSVPIFIQIRQKILPLANFLLLCNL